jgi:ssDNA-binding Zn-finger/Zn-ribbon topoisomerase 1
MLPCFTCPTCKYALYHPLGNCPQCGKPTGLKIEWKETEEVVETEEDTE